MITKVDYLVLLAAIIRNLYRYQWNEWQLRREALAVASEGEKRSEAVQVGIKSTGGDKKSKK